MVDGCNHARNLILGVCVARGKLGDHVGIRPFKDTIAHSIKESCDKFKNLWTLVMVSFAPLSSSSINLLFTELLKNLPVEPKLGAAY